MTKGVNKVILVGNLGADPDTRYTTSGSAICTLSVATTDQWKDKQTGKKQEKTEWHRVKMFGKLAEISQEYLRKGSQVFIEGSLRTSKYTGKDGIERYSTDIVARDMQMLGGRGGEGGNHAPRSAAPAHASAPASAPATGGAPPDDGGFEDDDIPF